MPRAFITGSRAYGMPREDSDVDLVVMVDPADLRLLRALDELESDPHYESDTACIRFGKLNLLCTTDEADFAVWREGTDELIARRPVTRDEAIAVFVARRKALEDERAAALAADIREHETLPGTRLALCPECAAYGMACGECEEQNAFTVPTEAP